jgi:tetratricopeptide (TPR) repeat protein
MAQLNRVGQKPSVVLTGTWGVGKTQLAAAYARARLADNWRLIAWIDARDSETLLAGLAAVAEAAGLSIGARSDAANAGQAVRRWLEADGNRHLLVLDGAEDPGLLRPFVPDTGSARILVTMAREPIPDLGTSVPVDVFGAEEALALLDGRSGLTDEAGASAVAAELGYLPLALDQAAAVIAGQHVGYAAYLERLRARSAGDYLVRWEDGEEQQPTSPGVAEAVLLSLEAASAADPLGVCLGVMEFVAMLSPAAVRRDLLRAAGQAGPLLGRGRRVAAPMVDQALERLNEWSLLGFSLNGQAVSLHGLVARVVRGWLARRGRFATACQAAATALEESAIALAKSPDHAMIREMLGQISALLENAAACTDDPDEKLAKTLIRLRSLALDHLMELGDSTQRAIAIGEPLNAELERLLGASHPDTMNARNRLAAAYQDAGRGAEAIRLFEQTLADRERRLGPDDPDTMRSRSDLARAYREAGRVADAVPLIEQTLAARERVFGADHPSTLASRNNLASAYRATGRATEAIPLFEMNVATCERLFGADHPKTLASRHNLGRAYQESAQAANKGR